MGELTSARERFEQSLALYRPEMHDSQIAQSGTDLGVAGHCYHALTFPLGTTTVVLPPG